MENDFRPSHVKVKCMQLNKLFFSLYSVEQRMYCIVGKKI